MPLRARLLLLVAVPLTVVGVLLAAGLMWWHREAGGQPSLGNDLPAMDQAVTLVVNAAGEQTPLAFSGVFEGSPCTVGPLNHGGHFTRSVDLYTDPGREATLVDRIATALPAAYQPQRGTPIGSNAAPLTADAGTGVELSVNQISPGWVVARARTGCSSGNPPADAGVGIADTPDADTLNRLLTALGTRAAQTHQHSLGCPGGDTTVDVVSQPTDAADLPRRLNALIPASSHRISTQSNRVTYRQGGTSVIVAASDDNTAITIQHTSPC